MALNITYQIIKKHLLAGELAPGAEIAIAIDQTLTQDATGTMAYLQLEALGVDRVQTELSVSYVDHNTLQNSFENADDHRYLQSVAARYGIYFPGPATASATRSTWSASARPENPAGLGQPHPHRRGAGHAGLRRRGAGCGRGHGRRALLFEGSGSG